MMDPEASPGRPAPMVESLVLLNERYWAELGPGKQSKAISNKQKELNEAMNAFWNEFIKMEPIFSQDQGKNEWRQEDADDFLTNLLDRIERELDAYVKWYLDTIFHVS